MSTIFTDATLVSEQNSTINSSKLKGSLKQKVSIFKSLSLLTFLMLFLGVNGVKGQILTFDFAGLAGNEATANSNSNNANLTSSTISRGAGLTASANADRFNATGWAVTSIANAVSGNDYMEFTISPNSGFQFTVSSIVFQIQRSATGFTAVALRNSLDSYATNLDAQKSITDNTSTQTITFTFAQPNSSTAVTYRLYGFAESDTGTGGPGDGTGNDITVNGSVTSNINIDAVDDGPSVYPYNYVSGGTTYKTTWTSSDLFMFINGANQSEPVSIYLDVDPNVPVNGGSDANGTLVGLNYDGYTTRPNLPFRADICIYAHNGYREIFRRDGANGWTSIGSGNGGLNGSADDYTGNANGQYASNDNGNGNGSDDRREFRVAWARLLGSINGGVIPASFNMMSYISYSNGMYAQTPVENYNGNNVTGNANGIVRYFTVPTTTTPIATSPFANNSFTQPLTATNNSFGGISVYDFTMNSSGQQIARLNTGGDWVISNNLVVGAGTLFFGSGGSGYGNTTVGNINIVGGSLNMDQTNKTMNVTGNINIGAAGTLQLSGTIGGDMNVAGNWTNAGTFTPNNRLVSFNGSVAQTLTGPTTFDFLTINNTAGLTLQPSSAVNVNQTLALTNGRVTLGANNLTLASTGTITGFDATKYLVTNSTGQLRRTVGATSSIFPIGNTAYNPITFNNSGTSDIYGVRVVDGVHTTGAFNTKTVSRRWITSESVAGGSNLSIVGQYNTGEPNSGFAAATDPFIGFYNGTSWSQVAATAAGSNPFTFSSNSNLSPSDLTAGTGYFALGKDNAFISVASNLVITAISPSSPTAGSGFSVTVRSQDAYGEFVNVVAGTSFTLSTNGNAGAIAGTITGTIAPGTSTITVTGVTLASAGTGVTITATRNTGDILAAGTSTTFSVLEAATQLALVSVPATGNVGVNLTTFTVEARRPDNSVDNTYTGNITITKASGPGTLSGTLTIAAMAGIASFNTLQVDAAGIYTLGATSGALTPATSGNIVVSLVPVVLAVYTFTGTACSAGALSPSSVVTNVTFSSASSTVTCNNNSATSYSIGGSNWGTVFNAGRYVEFTVTPSSGYTLTATSLTFSHLRSAAGATNCTVRSSADNYAVDLITPFSVGTSSANANVMLSGAAFTSQTNGITFRIYGWGGNSTGDLRLDNIALNGNIICLDPTAFSVTGGGTRCSDGAGLAVGLSGSQLGINYQLKRDGSNEGSPMAGTGSALAFPVQTLAGIYTIEASNTNGSCNINVTMTGSATVNILPDYTITATSGSNGTVTPVNNTTVCSGNNQTYTITPDVGFIISDLTVDGTASTALTTGTYTSGGTYVFNNVTANHTISATFVLGCTAPTALTYSTNPATYCINNTIAPNTPSFTGDAATGYTVSPALPSGLSLHATTGVISGMPTVAAGAADYVVTVTNGCGSTTATVNITVTPSVTAGTLSGTPQSILVGGTTTFTSDVAGGMWSSDNVNKATVNNTSGLVTGTGLGSTLIAYTVTGCNGPATSTRTVNVACGPGYYFNNGCVICPAGNSCSGNTTEPVPCPAGTFSNVEGAETCTNCPVNTFNNTTGQTACLNCPMGEYSPGGATMCTSCPAGYYYDSMTGLCTICPAGSYCPMGATAPTPCPPGQFSALEGSPVCISCAAGTSQALSGQTMCVACPPGTFSSVEGAEICTNCPANTYNNFSGSIVCSDCPMGQFSLAGSPLCTACPAGKYFNTMTGMCTDCPPGSYCPLGSAAPVPCPPGQYTAVIGSAVCIPCMAGTSQSMSGQTSCVNCPAGSFSNTQGAMSCTDCPPNTNSGVGGTMCFPDQDEDGIENSMDNCPNNFNPGQQNSDSDAFGDACDCDDTNSNVYPGATEICNGIDDDCDGSTDEGAGVTYYQDTDGDSYGNPLNSQQSCIPLMGYVTDNTDCDDNDALEKPGQVWYTDADNDGYPSNAATVMQCLRPANGKLVSELTALTVDCNDSNMAVNPGATEVCNGLDDDCDGNTDPSCAYCTNLFVTDSDGDYAAAATWQDNCPPPSTITVGVSVIINHAVVSNAPITVNTGGSLLISATGSLNISSTLTFTGTFTNLGMLKGTGSIIGDFINNGVYSPGN